MESFHRMELELGAVVVIFEQSRQMSTEMSMTLTVMMTLSSHLEITSEVFAPLKLVTQHL